MKSDLRSLLDCLKNYFSNLYQENLSGLILYGSQARGESTVFSDIDLLVVLKNPVNPIEEIKKTNADLAKLSLEYDQDISCLFMTEDRYQTEQSSLLKNIRQEGFAL